MRWTCPRCTARRRREITRGPGGTATGARNFTNSRREIPYDINTIVIHVTQGSWSSAINYFASPSNNGSSGHYTVRSSDGFIGQSVREADVAWHAGSWPTNTHSIGIEHEGYVNQPGWFTDAMYRSSAKLSAYLAVKYHIPINRKHIIGHNEVPGCPGGGGGVSCHTDPGRRTGDGPSTWTSSRAMPGLHPAILPAGRGQLYAWPFQGLGPLVHEYQPPRPPTEGESHRVLARPLAVSDNAEFKISTPASDSYRVYGWWPADPGYNAKTIFKIRTAGGWVNLAVNQRDQRRTLDLPRHVRPARRATRTECRSRARAPVRAG